MNKFLIAALLSSGLLSTAAFAADTATINATASVLGTCNFVERNGFLNFGLLDGRSMSDVQATANLTYACTNGTQAIVTINNGVNFSKLKTYEFGGSFGDVQDEIRYDFTTVGGNQIGQGHAGADLQYTVNANIPYANYQTAKAGFYLDTIFVTVAE